jgi:hypothetical protein
MAGRSSGSLIQKTRSSEWKGLTDKQREANRLLGGEQRHSLLVGGASSGKTFTIVRRIMARVCARPDRVTLSCAFAGMQRARPSSPPIQISNGPAGPTTST